MNGTRMCLSAVAWATILSMQSTAQWMQTNGPYTEVTTCLAVVDSTLYAGSYRGGVFVSDDYGDTWTEIDGGILYAVDDTGFTQSEITALAVLRDGDGPRLFAGTKSAGLFRSVNADTVWEPANNGLRGMTICALLARSFGDSSSKVFVATDSGLFVSTNEGTHWTAIPLRGDSSGVNDIVSNASHPYEILVVTNSGVFRSSDAGDTWNRLDLFTFPWNWLGVFCAVGDSLLIAPAYEGRVFRSTDYGVSWSEGNGTQVHANLTSFVASDTQVFGGGGLSVYLSLDSGFTWSYTGGPQCGGVEALAVCGPYLMAAVEHAFSNLPSVCRRRLSEMTTDVSSENIKQPNSFELEQNFPNPFNPSTSIRYSIATGGNVYLTIYNSLGQRVREAFQGFQESGNFVIEWDGLDACGLAVCSGTYYCVLRLVNENGNTQQRVKPMILLK